MTIFRSKNIIKGIGNISELNIDFSKSEKYVLIKGSIIINIRNTPLYANVYITNKDKQKYYDFIKFLGVPYKYIQNIDETPFVHQRQLINSGIGTISVAHKEIIKINNINNNKVLFYGKLLNNHSMALNNIEHYSINDADEYIDITLTGIKIDNNHIMCIFSNNYYQMIEILLPNNLQTNDMYDLEVGFKSGFETNDSIVKGNKQSCFIIKGYKKNNCNHSSDIISKFKNDWDIRQELKKTK